MRKKIRRYPLQRLIEKWKRRCEIGKDAHVAISGDEGDGKSSLSCYWILKRHFKGDLWENVVYTKNPKEFYDKYENLERGGCMVIDEAIEIISRVDWAKLEVKELVKKFAAQVRKEKNAVFVYNIQLFRELHQYWRNHRIRYWIELMPREWFRKGVSGAMVLQRQRVPFITGKKDAWLLDEEEKLWLKRMSKRGALIGKEYFDMLRQHPFYIGEFKFKEPPQRFYKQYHKYRLEAIEAYMSSYEIEKTSKQVVQWRARLGKILYLLNKGFPYKCDKCNSINTVSFSQQELAEMTGIKAYQTIGRLIKFYQQAVKAGLIDGEEKDKKS